MTATWIKVVLGFCVGVTVASLLLQAEHIESKASVDSAEHAPGYAPRQPAVTPVPGAADNVRPPQVVVTPPQQEPPQDSLQVPQPHPVVVVSDQPASAVVADQPAPEVVIAPPVPKPAAAGQVAVVTSPVKTKIYSRDGIVRESLINISQTLGLPDYQVENCYPVQEIEYVKIYKSSSTTVANLLWRYYFFHEMKGMAVPASPTMETNKCQQGGIIKKYDEYSMVLNHHNFIRSWYHEKLPNGKLMTIMRDPIVRFVSAFNYRGSGFGKYKIPKSVGLEEAIHRVLASEKHRKTIMDGPSGKELNHQRKFMGWESNCNTNPTDWEEFKQMVRDEYDIIMVTERMSESLVALQHEMCWRLEDVVDTMTNNKPHAKADEFLTEEELAFLRKALAWDYEIYNIANELLDEKLARLPACGVNPPGVMPMCLDDHLKALDTLKTQIGETCGSRIKDLCHNGRVTDSHMCEFQNTDVTAVVNKFATTNYDLHHATCDKPQHNDCGYCSKLMWTSGQWHPFSKDDVHGKHDKK